MPIVSVIFFFLYIPLSMFFLTFTHPQYNKRDELWWKLLLNFHRNRRTMLIILHTKKKQRNCVTMLNDFFHIFQLVQVDKRNERKNSFVFSMRMRKYSHKIWYKHCTGSLYMRCSLMKNKASTHDFKGDISTIRCQQLGT